jgi:hypothetical protein
MGQSEIPSTKIKKKNFRCTHKNLVDQAISTTMVNGSDKQKELQPIQTSPTC